MSKRETYDGYCLKMNFGEGKTTCVSLKGSMSKGDFKKEKEAYMEICKARDAKPKVIREKSDILNITKKGKRHEISN